MRTLLLILVTGWLSLPSLGHAAVGCSLQNPDTDIRRFFPEMTNYSIHLLTYARQAPEAHDELRRRIGQDLDSVYEVPDTPYTLYVVNGQGRRLGYVFGTNQRGKYSNIQVVAIVDAELKLQHVYIQKIRSPAFEAFQAEDFGLALAALPLSQYPTHQACYIDGDCAQLPVVDPSEGTQSEDFRAIVRALAKLEILSETLLQPGSSPVPRNSDAREEWIGNAGGVEPSRQVREDPPFDEPSHSALSPEAQVVLWTVGDESRIFPVAMLTQTPIVRLTHQGLPYVLSWSDSSSTAVVHQTDLDLRMTSDLLFGVRLLVDSSTGSRVHPILGTVYGSLETQLEPMPGVRLLSAREARSIAPSAQIMSPLSGISSTVRPSLRPVGELVWVQMTDQNSVATIEGAVHDTPIEVSSEIVQMWMTLEGYRSTFPEGSIIEP
jgi:hypothetical protein